MPSVSNPATVSNTPEPWHAVQEPPPLMLEKLKDPKKPVPIPESVATTVSAGGSIVPPAPD
eukprot:6271709-Amphidinium_carterae.1